MVVCHRVSRLIARMIQPAFMPRFSHAPHVEYDVEGLSGCLKCCWRFASADVRVRVSAAVEVLRSRVLISELQPGERADRPRGLLCVIAKVPITIIPLRKGILSEGTAILPHRRPA